MNGKTRLVVGIGALAAIGIAVGARHCLRSMAPSRGLSEAIELCQGRSAQCCGPADCGQRANHDQSEETAALAA